VIPPSIWPFLPLQLVVSARASVRYSKSLTTISEDAWPPIRARYAAGESFRTLAASYEVSHETMRRIIQRTTRW
jgi:hypothetical protein